VLADRLKRGALPLDRALVHGVEIAEALHEAHRFIRCSRMAADRLALALRG
jgi:hypothetical protein